MGRDSKLMEQTKRWLADRANELRQIYSGGEVQKESLYTNVNKEWLAGYIRRLEAGMKWHDKYKYFVDQGDFDKAAYAMCRVEGHVSRIHHDRGISPEQAGEEFHLSYLKRMRSDK